MLRLRNGGPTGRWRQGPCWWRQPWALLLRARNARRRPHQDSTSSLSNGARSTEQSSLPTDRASFSAQPGTEHQTQIYTTRTDALMSRPIELTDSQLLSISSKGEMAIRQRTNDVFSQGMLSVVPLTGGAPRELLGDVVDASWSPDGDSLAAVHVTAEKTGWSIPSEKPSFPLTRAISAMWPSLRTGRDRFYRSSQRRRHARLHCGHRPFRQGQTADA